MKFLRENKKKIIIVILIFILAISLIVIYKKYNTKLNEKKIENDVRLFTTKGLLYVLNNKIPTEIEQDRGMAYEYTLNEIDLDKDIDKCSFTGGTYDREKSTFVIKSDISTHEYYIRAYLKCKNSNYSAKVYDFLGKGGIFISKDKKIGYDVEIEY